MMKMGLFNHSIIKTQAYLTVKEKVVPHITFVSS